MKYLLPLSLAFVLVACGGASEAQADETSTVNSTTEGDWIQDDFDAAMALSAETGKPIFIDMYADWCGPCRMLADEYFPREDYQEILAQCVLLKINIDNYPQYAEQYRVQSIPTLILTDANGTEFDRITGVMGSPEEFLPMISEFISQGL